MREETTPLTREASAHDAAARWALRCAEGLTAQEERALADWIAADPGHAGLLAERRAAWDRFEPLASAQGEIVDDVTFAPRRPSRARVPKWALPALGAAALVAFGIWMRVPAGPSAASGLARVLPPPLPLPAPGEQRTLPDGTVVELNRDSDIALEFTGAERRVRLVRGEASFAVAKDPERPFIVAAGAVEARALGTVFNVRRETAVVEILVTEGTVRVESPVRGTNPPSDPLVLTAGQQIVVAGDSRVVIPGVKNLSPEEMEQRLAWQSRLLEFDDAPLADIVAAFNRRNRVHLFIDDPTLAAVRMTASFRSSNVESFVRLLEGNYGIRVSARDSGAIHLRRR